MKRFLVVFLALFIVGCDLNHVENLYEPDKNELANIALRKAAKNLKQKANLRLSGDGGQMMDQIKMLALSFHYYELIDIEKGRELLISSVNELVTTVNEDLRIRPYLANYPFDYRNVEIRIFLYNPDGSFVSKGNLSVIKADRGEFTYAIDDPKDEFAFKIKILKETYEEALAKQQESTVLKNERAEKIAM